MPGGDAACCEKSALLSKCWKATSKSLLFLGGGQNAEPDFVLSADILSSSEALKPLQDRVRLGDFHGCGSKCRTRDARTLGAPNWLGLASAVASGSAWDLKRRCTDNCVERYVHDAILDHCRGPVSARYCCSRACNILRTCSMSEVEPLKWISNLGVGLRTMAMAMKTSSRENVRS